jgi:hypothetical protein
MLQCNFDLMNDDPQTLARLRAKLAELDYPWPKVLKDKDAKWLENELKLLETPPSSPNQKTE